MMEEAGFTVEDATSAIFALGSHILGSVIAEQEGPAGHGDVRVDPRRFPRIARAARLRTRGRDHDREFEYGLEIFVAGCRATLPRR